MEQVRVLLESSVWMEGDLLVLDFSLAMEQVRGPAGELRVDGGRPPGPGLQPRHGADEGSAGELCCYRFFSTLYFYSKKKVKVNKQGIKHS